MRFQFLTFAFSLLIAAAAAGHDVWLETNTTLVRLGECIEIDLKLGNHGNNHRDFKQASKLSDEATALQVISPSGKRHDLKSALIDVGYTSKEGYWSASFLTTEPGYHVALSVGDRVINHGTPVRSVRSAKAFWLADRSLDKPAKQGNSVRESLDLPFELTMITDPLDSAVGKPLTVCVLKRGKPVIGQVVSFIPRGVELAAEGDPGYEYRTNQAGEATFVPKEANLHLIVARQVAADERSEQYAATQYVATLFVRTAHRGLSN